MVGSPGAEATLGTGGRRRGKDRIHTPKAWKLGKGHSHSHSLTLIHSFDDLPSLLSCVFKALCLVNKIQLPSLTNKGVIKIQRVCAKIKM